MSTSTQQDQRRNGERKVAIQSILIEQLEGKPKKLLCTSVEQAIDTVRSYNTGANHYKGRFVITWENDDTYTGSALFYPDMKEVNPLEWARSYLAQLAAPSDNPYWGNSKEAQEFLNKYFD